MLTAGDPLAAHTFDTVRRRAIFDCCKWDPQSGDTGVLAPYPLFLQGREWGDLRALAERLYQETLAAEIELLQRPDLHPALGLPSEIRAVLREPGEPPPAAVRVMRFDFHPTRDGWRISEVNSDVPGGFNEASGFTALMAEHYVGTSPAGDPAGALAASLARRLPSGGVVAMAHATAYADDRQIMEYLGKRMKALDLRPVFLSPAHLRWKGGRAWMETDWQQGWADAVLRFFPAEWLPNLPEHCGWRTFFRGALTHQGNPPTALLTQSKRFPLVWDALQTALPTWRLLMPETRHPHKTLWERGDWVLKPALGRVGEDVGIPGVTSPKEWRQITRNARWFPRHWAAQRRFEAIPLRAGSEQAYPCLGIYVVDGQAEGAYVRLAARPLIDGKSRDAALLVEAS